MQPTIVMTKRKASSAKYAIISDPHGNLHALDAVLEDADRIGASVTLCAGDLVGYCAYPNEVVSALKKRNAFCVRGNHDRAVFTIESEWNMNPQAAAALRWTVKNVTEDTKEFLRGLRPWRDLTQLGLFPGIVGAGLFHGSPFDENEYVEEPFVNDAMMEVADVQLVITGHTHSPFVKCLATGVWVNPGSVGQPRDFDWRASYVIYDERTGTFEIRRLKYDVQAAADAIIRVGLPIQLSLRLFKGW